MASQGNWNAALPCTLRAGVTVFDLNHAACLQLIRPHQPNNPPPTDPHLRPLGGLIFNAVTCPPRRTHRAGRGSARLQPAHSFSPRLASNRPASKTHNHQPPQIFPGHPPCTRTRKLPVLAQAGQVDRDELPGTRTPEVGGGGGFGAAGVARWRGWKNQKSGT
jgi:hypothetical protein